eukprot:TRINITY_DN5528_c0_g1_i1.p1 TRINITY_DN5528_c0_g1~~TRINITY_DN5528_c0_g1_i1.p1  ORF type:complete len:270 (-),score=45.88 TRINITY_DN5528_c0_g1_i1:281-1090(-)
MADSVFKASTVLADVWTHPKHASNNTRVTAFGLKPHRRSTNLHSGRYVAHVWKAQELKVERNPESEIDGTTVVECEEKSGSAKEKEELASANNAFLFSFAPLPVLVLAALPGAESVRSLFGPFVETVKSWNLPDWLVHWGHPGNMAVVLFAMGGYGSYLGWQIRLSDDVEVKAKAKDLHPKLLGGMFFFFALGATGGITSLLTSDKPILESPHAVTGIIGLALLTLQTAMTTLFEGNPGLRTAHGFLGSGIMGLFLIHAILGLQLGLSY